MRDNSGKVTRGTRGNRESAPAQFRELRLCRIIMELLPDGPSELRVELRNIMGELNEEMNNHRTRASDTSVAWDNEDGEIPE